MKQLLTKTAFCLSALLLIGFGSSSAYADGLVFSGAAPIQPAGFGTRPYILGIQHQGNNTTVTGGVARSGNSDVIFESSGTNVLQGAQTQTRTLGEAGITQASDLRLFFNINEPNAAGKETVTLQSLILTAFDSQGTAVFSASLTQVPLTLTEIGPGQGTSDYFFSLDEAAIARLQAVFSTDLRIGLATSISAVQGGPESFFLGSAGGNVPPSAPIPEPATMLLLGTGLAGVAAKVRKRRSASTTEQA